MKLTHQILQHLSNYFYLAIYRHIIYFQSYGCLSQINKYSLDGEFIEMYDSCTIASQQNNISMGSISGCCNKHHKTAGGYIWRYADEVNMVV